MRHPARTILFMTFLTAIALAAVFILATGTTADQGIARSSTYGPVEKALNPDSSVEYRVTFHMPDGHPGELDIRINYSKSEGGNPDDWTVKMRKGNEEIDREDTHHIKGGQNPETVTIRYEIKTTRKDVEMYKGDTLVTKFWCDILEGEGNDTGDDSNITTTRSIISERDDASVYIESKYHNKKISLTLADQSKIPMAITNIGWERNNTVIIKATVEDSPDTMWDISILPTDHMYDLDSLETDDSYYLEIVGDPYLVSGIYRLKLEIFIGNNGHIIYELPIKVPAPDLTVYDIIPSHTNALIKKEITITAIVTNYGGYVDTLEVEFLVQSPSGPMRSLAIKTVKNVKNRAQIEVSATYPNTDYSLKRGDNTTLLFRIRLDPLGKVLTEEDRTNNEATTSINSLNVETTVPSFSPGPAMVAATIGIITTCAVLSNRRTNRRGRDELR